MANDRKVRLIIEVDGKEVTQATADLQKMGVVVHKVGDEGAPSVDKLTGAIRTASAEGEILGRVIGKSFNIIASGAQEAVHVVVASAKAFEDQGVAIDKARQITGLHTDQLSALLMQTRRVGLSYNDLGDGIKSYIKLIGDANDGSKTAEGRMTQLLGQDWKARSKNLDASLASVFQRIEKAPDDITATNVAMAAFGDAGARLIPFVKSFHGDMDSLVAKAKELGVVMGEDDVKAAHDYQEATKDFDEVLHSIVITLGRDYLPILKQATVDAGGWLQANKGEIKSWAEATGDILGGLIQSWKDLKNAADSYAAAGYFGAAGEYMHQDTTGSGWTGILLGGLGGYMRGKGQQVRKANSYQGGLNDQFDELADMKAHPENYTVAPPFFTGDKPAKAKAPKKEHVLSPEAKTIIDHATALGISPLDLATILLYEGAGSLSTSQFGGKGGKYLGPMQMGPWEQGHYGVKPGMSLSSYLDSASKFLADRGVKPGANLLELYEAVNGGHVGVSPNASDGNGTIAEHVQRMMRDRMPQAKKMFEGFSFDAQSVQDDVARMLSQQSDQLTKEARDKNVQLIIQVWKAAGFIPSGSVLSEIERSAADEAKKSGVAQPTAGDIIGMFQSNRDARAGARGPVDGTSSTGISSVIGRRTTSTEDYLENFRQSLQLTTRMTDLDERRANFESIINLRLLDQKQTQDEQLQQLEEELTLLQRGDIIAEADLKATERHVYLQREIRDLRVEVMNLGKDDADQIEIARLQKIIELRNRDRDAVIAIQDAQMELNKAMEVSNVQIRAGVYEHIAQQRTMSQAYSDGINQTYDALDRLVNGPLDKLEAKTKGLLSFVIEPAKAYASHAIGSLFTSIVDKVFPDGPLKDALKSTGNPVLDEAKKQTDYLKQIARNTGGMRNASFSGGGGFGGGGGGFEDLLGQLTHGQFGSGAGSGGGPSGGGGGASGGFDPSLGGVLDPDTGDWASGTSSGGGGIFGSIKNLFSTGQGGLFAPRKNVLTGNDSKWGGILGGAGVIASFAGGLIGGNAGGVLSDVGMGLQIGSMFGPIGAGIGAVIGLAAGLFGISSKRKQEEKIHNQLMLDALDQLKQLDDLIAGVRRGGDSDSAIAQAQAIGQQVKQQYLQQVNQLTDKKTRNIAIADGARIDAIVAQKIQELQRVAEISKADADRAQRILPEFASGVFISPSFRRYNGLLPGSFMAQDNVPALISPGEAVLTPMQMQRARVAAGFDVFAEAGIPNYPNSNPSPGLATGGIAGPGTGLGGQIVVRPEFTLFVEGVVFTDQARAWIESDDGSRSLVKVVQREINDGTIQT